MEVDTDCKFKTFDTIGDRKNSDIKQCVKDIVKKEGYVSYSIEKQVITTDGGNYLGVLCEVNIKGETPKGNKETNIFMKVIIPASAAQITIISLPEAFKRELFAYQELSKIFVELQNEVCISEKDQYKMIKCYDESNPNVIILENMSKKGFKTNFRMDLITLQYAEIAIQELAKFHALSFVLEWKRPEYFERNIKTMGNPLNFDEDWDSFVHNMCQITLNYLDDDSRRKLEDLIPSFNEKYRKYFFGKAGRLCLRHGDYRPNNILVKETNGDISEMIPIDYQLICYGCPILDFIYFIFPSTDQKFRRAYLPYLKELYYESLRKFLKYFSLDIAKVYNRKDFDSDYKEMLDYGLMISINLVPLLMACENDIPDITKEPLAGLNFNIDVKCKERLVGLVEDFIEWGYL